MTTSINFKLAQISGFCFREGQTASFMPHLSCNASFFIAQIVGSIGAYSYTPLSNGSLRGHTSKVKHLTEFNWTTTATQIKRPYEASIPLYVEGFVSHLKRQAGRLALRYKAAYKAIVFSLAN